MPDPISFFDPAAFHPLVPHTRTSPGSEDGSLYTYQYRPDTFWPRRSFNYIQTSKLDSMPPGSASTVNKVYAANPQQTWKAKSSNSNYENWRMQHERMGGDLADWPLHTFNRYRIWWKQKDFQVWKQPAVGAPYEVIDEWGVGSNVQADLQIGGYMRKPVYNDSQESWSNNYFDTLGNPRQGHTYHRYMLSPEPVWQQLIVDNKPQHTRNSSGGTVPYMIEPYTDYPDYSYIDSQADIYIQPEGLRLVPVPGSKYGASYYSGAEVFEDAPVSIVDEQLLVYHISSLTGAYQPTMGKFHLGYCCARTGYDVQIAYSFLPTGNQAWGDLTPLTTRPNSSDGNINVTETHGFLADVPFDPGNPAHDVVYFAFRVSNVPGYSNEVSEGWGHREIALATDPTQLPPLPGVTA